MSRKDARCVSYVALTPDVQAALQARRRPGRSLGDVARRMIEAGLVGEDLPVVPLPEGRKLMVQLPARTERGLQTRAASEGRAREEVIAAALLAGLARV